MVAFVLPETCHLCVVTVSNKTMSNAMTRIRLMQMVAALPVKSKNSGIVTTPSLAIVTALERMARFEELRRVTTEISPTQMDV